MKKLVSVLFVSLLVGGLAFAADPSLAVTAWGRTYFNVAEGSSADGADMTTSTGPSWQRVGFTVTGTSDNAGILVDVYGTDYGTATVTVTDDNGDVSTVSAEDFFVGDQAKMWITFNPMATLSIGKIQGNTLRGKLGGGWISSSGLEDAIFKRFYPTKGLLLDLKPVDGLYVGAAIDSAADNGTALLEDTYKAIQVGAGYTVKDVGLVRAQYVGSATDEMAYAQAAFAYTGMAGLTVDVGASIPLGDGTVLAVAGGAKYAKDAITVAPRAKFTNTEDDANLDIYLDLGYALDKMMSVNLESKMTGLLSTTTDVIAATPYLKMAYAKGEFRIGATIMMSTPDGGDATTTWAIPVGMQVAF